MPICTWYLDPSMWKDVILRSWYKNIEIIMILSLMWKTFKQCVNEWYKCENDKGKVHIWYNNFHILTIV